MTQLIVGLYGLYLVIVGAQGNAPGLFQLLTNDAPRYLPWLLAIVVIAILAEYEATRDLVQPFIFLLIINFILFNFEPIRTEISRIYNAAVQ